MSFLRPEAKAKLRRWGEPAIMAGAAAIAFWIGVGQALDKDLFAIGTFAFGLFFAISAVASLIRQIAAGSSKDAGPGVVTVEEGMIRYFGPEQGGITAIDALVSVELVRSQDGPESPVFWLLRDELGRDLAIPGGAVDTERLFDALGTLDGISYQAMLDAKLSDTAGRFPVWRRPGNDPGTGPAISGS
ncbi:MAG: hypothetical protein OEN23_18280 [Paracoccaceae bacterium]|nr:hypothetical protein [Paracoccaceae bacterium]